MGDRTPREAYAEDVIKELFSAYTNTRTPTPDERSQQMERLKPLLVKSLMKSLKHVEERFRTYLEDFEEEITLGQNKRINRSILLAERFVQSKFNDRDMNSPEAQSNTHKQALRNCLPSLKEDIDDFHATVVDDLGGSDFTSGVDSLSDRGSQTGQHKSFHDRVIDRITQDEFHTILVPAIYKKRDDVARELLVELERLEEDLVYTQCLACRAKGAIQVKRLATPLLVSGAIDLTTHGELSGTATSDSVKWAELLKRTSRSAIMEVIEKKYPNIQKELDEKGVTSLDCTCAAIPDTVSRPRQRSDRPPNRAPSIASTVETDTIEQSQENELDKMEAMSVLTMTEDEILAFQMNESEQAYKLTSKPRGVCVIINNINFSGRINKHRLGSEIDAKRLTQTFERLEFTVTVETNLTSDEMQTVMENLARRTDHTKYDAFVCCILTHGVDGRVFGTDGKGVNLTDLTGLFKSSSCPSLAGKPKMFFIQADRGSSQMGGFSGNPDTERGLTDPESIREVIADEADFLIGHCTSAGYASFRSCSRGTWYINKLTEVLDSQADNHDLLLCLLMVNKEIASANARLSGNQGQVYKQVPAPVFTLTKRLLLTSDPFWLPDDTSDHP